MDALSIFNSLLFFKEKMGYVSSFRSRGDMIEKTVIFMFPIGE